MTDGSHSEGRIEAGGGAEKSAPSLTMLSHIACAVLSSSSGAAACSRAILPSRPTRPATCAPLAAPPILAHPRPLCCLVLLLLLWIVVFPPWPACLVRTHVDCPPPCPRPLFVPPWPPSGCANHLVWRFVPRAPRAQERGANAGEGRTVTTSMTAETWHLLKLGKKVLNRWDYCGSLKAQLGWCGIQIRPRRISGVG